jgi:hypothetical protein
MMIGKFAGSSRSGWIPRDVCCSEELNGRPGDPEEGTCYPVPTKITKVRPTSADSISTSIVDFPSALLCCCHHVISEMMQNTGRDGHFQALWQEFKFQIRVS